MSLTANAVLTTSASMNTNAPSTASTSSTANFNQEIKNITDFFNINLQYTIDAGLSSGDEPHTKRLRDVLARMQTDTVLQNAIINFRKSFVDLNACLVSIYGTTSNAFLKQRGYLTSSVFSATDSSFIANIFLIEKVSSIEDDLSIARSNTSPASTITDVTNPTA